MSDFKQKIDREIEALKQALYKVIIMYSVTSSALTGLFRAYTIIAAQPHVFNPLAPREEVIQEEPPKSPEVDEAVQSPPPSHNMVGSSNPQMPARIAGKEEMDPKNFVFEVPEEKVRWAHMHTGGFNVYTQLLITADVFRQAELEPIFLTNKDESIIRVAARETWNKPNAIN